MLVYLLKSCSLLTSQRNQQHADGIIILSLFRLNIMIWQNLLSRMIHFRMV